jgi:hypothetical protein
MTCCLASSNSFVNISSCQIEVVVIDSAYPVQLLVSVPIPSTFLQVLPAANVICAVCKDEVLMGEKVTQLPCKHYCPVCRFELPTDDADYERKKHESGG